MRVYSRYNRGYCMCRLLSSGGFMINLGVELDWKETYLWYPKYRDLLQITAHTSAFHQHADGGEGYLLLEITPILLVDKHEVQIIPCAELLVHVPERRRQVEPA